MQKEKEQLCNLETAVKELLSIVKTVQDFSNEMERLEAFLFQNKKRVVALGKSVAVCCGISPSSKEALLFGKLIVANLLFNNIKSIDFLTAVLEKTISISELRTNIVNFVEEIDTYIAGDKKTFVKQIKKELEVLEQIKGAVKGAKYDSKWKEEIEALEKKMKKITVSLSNKKKSKKKSSQRKKKSQKFTRQEYQEVLNTLETISTLQCFCNFSIRNTVSKYFVLREILMHFLETDSINYLYVLPKMCGKCTKTSIEMCAPVLIAQTHISTAQLYVISTLRKLSSINKKYKEETDILIDNLKKTGSFQRSLLAYLLLQYAPSRKTFIIQTITSRKESIFYTNMIRVLYLTISDTVCNLLFYCCTNMRKDILSILLGANYIYHQSLLRYHAQKENISGPDNGIEEKNILSSFLYNQYFFDGFCAVKIVTDGIFSSGSVLYPYFLKYHLFRGSILRSMLDILSRKLARNALHRYYTQSRLAEEERRVSAFLPLVQRRLLNLLRILSIRFLNSKKPIREFLLSVKEEEFEKRGLFGYPSEISVFLSASFPLVLFSIFSLYQLDTAYLCR